MPNINEERKARLKKRAARKDTKAAKAEAPVEQKEFGPAQELKAALESGQPLLRELAAARAAGSV